MSVLLTILLFAQAAADKGANDGGLTLPAMAGIITGAATAGAALLGGVTAYRKRKDEARRMENEEDSIVITQAQGANLILDATIKALNTQLEREGARADREQARAESIEARVTAANARVDALQRQVDSEKARADTAERALDIAQRQLRRLRGSGA